MKVDEFTGYRNLHDAVARVLFAAAGTRRPAERAALRAYREVGRLLEEHLINGATYGQRAIARLAADLNLLPRPALRRVRAHVESRLFVYAVTCLRPVAAATLQVQIELGFDVLHECCLRLRPPAHKLSRAALVTSVESTSLPILARSVRLPREPGYGVHLYRVSDLPNPVAATTDHLNDVWPSAHART